MTAGNDFMTTEFDSLLPELKEFSIPDIPFKVVDPTALPERTSATFNEFMTDSSQPGAFLNYQKEHPQLPVTSSFHSV